MIVCPKLAYAAVFLIYCTTTIQCYKCLSYSFVYMIHYRSGNLLFLIFTQPKGHSCAELLEYWVDTGLVCFVFVPTKYKYKYKCKPSLILCPCVGGHRVVCFVFVTNTNTNKIQIQIQIKIKYKYKSSYWCSSSCPYVGGHGACVCSRKITHSQGLCITYKHYRQRQRPCTLIVAHHHHHCSALHSAHVSARACSFLLDLIRGIK